MNSAILLPLLAAACLAAPAPHLVSQPIALAAPAAVTSYTTHVQVPIHKTVHYQSNPVVTGYQTSIIKPAIATHTVAAPVLTAPAVIAAPAPVVVAEQPAVVAAPAPAVEAAPSPAPVQEVVAAAPAAAEPAPVQSDDTEVIENPEFRSAAPAPAAVASVAAAPAISYAAAPAISYAAAPAVSYAAAPIAHQVIAQPAAVYHSGPVVTQEKVLAPVRTHTQITPQVTQVQPEVTVRKVIHDVPVAQPVYTAPQVIHQHHVAAPAAVHYAAAPATVW